MNIKSALKTKDSLELKNKTNIDFNRFSNPQEVEKIVLTYRFEKGANLLQNRLDKIDKEFNIGLKKNTKKHIPR